MTQLKIIKEVQEDKFNIKRFELVYVPTKTKKLEKIEGEKIEEFQNSYLQVQLLIFLTNKKITINKTIKTPIPTIQ